MAYALRRTRRGRLAGARNDDVDADGSRMTATDRGANAAGSVLVLLARVVGFIFGLIVLVIVVAILMKLLGANPGNSIVKDFHDNGGKLVGPFKNLFSIHDAKLAILVNWGIAALVWSAIGSLIVRVLLGAAPARRY